MFHARGAEVNAAWERGCPLPRVGNGEVELRWIDGLARQIEDNFQRRALA